MKKVILTSFVVCSFLSSFGQFNKGRILIGGTGALSFKTDKSTSGNTTTTTGKTTTFSLAPTVGYFFVDNFAAGLGVSLEVDGFKSQISNTKLTSTTFQLSPFVRYYLKPGIFFQGSFGVGASKSAQSGTTTSDRSSGVSSWSLGAGYAWFLNDYVAIEPTIGYNTTIKKEGDFKYINGGFGINVGIQVYLGAK